MIHIGPLHIWKLMWRGGFFKWKKSNWFNNSRFGIFRNRGGSECRWCGRWGFYILGYEFGSRNHRDKFGMWLKRTGLWPW